MVLKILTVPDPILRQKTQAVKTIDGKITKLVDAMIAAATGAEGKITGVGLAAVQVGYPLRIIIIFSKTSRRFTTMINPEITWKSKRTSLGVKGSTNPLEGCLSVPGIWGRVRRHSIVKITYQTPKGSQVTRKYRGFSACVCQHEIDHLDGILFVDRVIEQNGKLYQFDRDEKGKDTLVEILLPAIR